MMGDGDGASVGDFLDAGFDDPVSRPIECFDMTEELSPGAVRIPHLKSEALLFLLWGEPSKRNGPLLSSRPVALPRRNSSPQRLKLFTPKPL